MLLNDMQISKQEFITVCIALIIFFVYHSIYVNPELPDFEAYKVIYESSGTSFSEGTRSLIFIGFGRLCQEIGLEYMSYRMVIKAVSICTFISALHLIVRKANDDLHLIHTYRTNPAVSFCVVFFAVYIFAFEFFEIRLRAGFAITFALLSFTLFINKQSVTKTRYNIFAFVAAIIALGSHAWTSVMLLYILFAPVLISKVFRILERRISTCRYFTVVFAAFLTISLFILHRITTTAEVERGEHLLSSLNPARFAFLSIFPILYVVSNIFHINFGDIGHNSDFTDVPYDSNNDDVYSFMNRYKVFVFLNYFAFAISLAIYYYFDLLKGSGEAIVRVYTLFIPVFMICMIFRDKIISRFFRLILIANGLFFVNTVYSAKVKYLYEVFVDLH